MAILHFQSHYLYCSEGLEIIFHKIYDTKRCQNDVIVIRSSNRMFIIWPVCCLMTTAAISSFEAGAVILHVFLLCLYSVRKNWLMTYPFSFPHMMAVLNVL